MSTLKEFVCVFLFDKTMSTTFLALKLKGPTPIDPDGQAGCLNGFGGKIEPEDTNPLYALVREVQEELGVNYGTIDYHHFHTETYPSNAIVYYYYIKLSDLETSNLLEMQVAKDGSNIVSVLMKDPTLFSKPLDSKHVFVWNVPYLLSMAVTLDKVPHTSWPLIQ